MELKVDETDKITLKMQKQEIANLSNHGTNKGQVQTKIKIFVSSRPFLLGILLGPWPCFNKRHGTLVTPDTGRIT